MAKPLNGERFEEIMNSLPQKQRTAETAATVMLVAEVTGMKNTVVEDLSMESASRKRNAEILREDAARLRGQAMGFDADADRHMSRRDKVEGLRSLLTGLSATEKSDA